MLLRRAGRGLVTVVGQVVFDLGNGSTSAAIVEVSGISASRER
jgi:hypothetical protein